MSSTYALSELFFIIHLEVSYDSEGELIGIQVWICRLRSSFSYLVQSNEIVEHEEMINLVSCWNLKMLQPVKKSMREIQHLQKGKVIFL